MPPGTLEHFISTYGYWALVLGTFFEGETILVVGGVAAHLGYLELQKVILVAFIGSFAGDQFYFFIGRLRGMKLVARHHAWQRRVDRVHSLFSKYHDLIILGFRFVYGMRIVTPIVLGMDKNVKTGRFVVLNAISAVLWSVLVAVGGYVFGLALQGFIKDIRHYELEIIAGVLGAGILLWIIHKIREEHDD